MSRRLPHTLLAVLIRTVALVLLLVGAAAVALGPQPAADAAPLIDSGFAEIAEDIEPEPAALTRPVMPPLDRSQTLLVPPAPPAPGAQPAWPPVVPPPRA